MHFGFSYIGLIYIVLLTVPNLIWIKNKPKDYEKYVVNENKILVLFERIGEITVTAIAVMFSDFNLRPWTLWSLWLVISFLLMILYEFYWLRYFRSGKTMQDQYRSFLYYPVAGASLPVTAFFLLGIYGTNILMIIAVIILGIGHIGIHLAHEREVLEKENIFSVKKRVFKGIGFVLLIVIFGTISFTIGVRNIRFVKHYPNFIHGVDEQAFIELGGQEQYVLIMGKDVSKPVVIYLHGGPASPDIMAMATFTDCLMDDYTFIGWEQRGAGKSYYRNKKNDPGNDTVSFERSLLDLDELVDYARNRFRQEKVIILGHSYGTIIGSKYALTHPEKISAYISVGQVVSVENGDLLSYQDALKKAKTAGDDTGKMEEAYKVYMENKTLTNMLALREPVAKYHPVPRESNMIWQGLSSPYFGIDDVKWFFKPMISIDGFIELNKPLFDYAEKYDVFDNGLDYQIPVYFISGSEDWICPVELVKEYAEAISAPHKNMIIIEGCGHYPQFDAPEEFAKHFIEKK